MSIQLKSAVMAIRKLRLSRAALLKVMLVSLNFSHGADKNPALVIKAEFVGFEIIKKKRGAEKPQLNFSTENS